MSLKHGLLGLLTYEDMSGYDLKKAFDTSLQFMWSAKGSQIYRDLGKLEDDGFVTSKVVPQEKKFDRKVYSITDKGKEAFLKWVRNFPDSLEVPIRDEFIVRVFFGENLGRENLLFEIRRFKKQREEALEELSVVSESAKEAAVQGGYEHSFDYWYFTIKKAQKEIQAEIEWAEETIEELKKRS